MRIALVIYDGVLDDECEAFRCVLGLVRDATIVTVGARAGRFAGPGGVQTAEVAFADLDHADVVVVPGGLGCERAADDPALREFLVRMERIARFVAASSTGSVVLAAAGLLHGTPAATHWLATDLLRRHGSETDGRRLAIHGNVVTCEGRISAVEAAFALVERLEGSDAVDRVRAMLIQRGQPLLRDPSRWEILVERILGRSPGGTRRRHATAPPTEPPTTPPTTPAASAPGAVTTFASPDDPPVTPLSVMIELVDNDELARQMRRSSRRRERRADTAT